MTLPDLLQWLALPGGTALILFIYHLHRDAVKAHEKRADDWKSAHDKQAARADELQKQVLYMASPIVEAAKGTTTG